MSRVTSKQERITPAKAEKYLASNVHNRPLRAATTHRLAAAIRRGEWVNNGETIKFNGDGKLIDGQHRLAAIVEADQAVDALIVSGLTSEAQETVDTGVRRNPADVLALRGFPHAVVVAAACKASFFQNHFGKLVAQQSATNYPTHQQMVEIAEKDRQNMIRVAEFSVGFREDHPELGFSAPMLAELTYIFALTTSLEKAEGFWDAVAMNQEGAPSVLRRSMIEDRVSRGRMSRNVRLAFAVKAFNAWLADRPIQRLSWKRKAGKGRQEFPAVEGA